MTDNEEPITTVTGKVKWFDPVKGFGFVVADSGGADILLHANVLRNFGQGSVADGSEIELSVQSTDRGVQAVEVQSIKPPELEDAGVLSEFEGVELGAWEQVVLQPARVKWFDKTKGFGFANVFGARADVFIHAEVLRQSGLSDLAPGEAIGLRIADGKRGQMAIRVSSWETALED